MNQTVKYEPQFLQAFNSQGIKDNFFLQNPPESNLFELIKELKINYEFGKNYDVGLVPKMSSTLDYNQSIHRTINRDDRN